MSQADCRLGWEAVQGRMQLPICIALPGRWSLGTGVGIREEPHAQVPQPAPCVTASWAKGNSAQASELFAIS